MDGHAREPASPAEADAALRALPLHLLRLPDGRDLAWTEVGDAAGVPLIYLHGTGFSRLEALTGAYAAECMDVRIVAFDRPSFGASSPNPGRTLDDGARDVFALADHLGLDKFILAGFSGGFPHALAAAAMFPQRVLALVGINTAADPCDPKYQQVPAITRWMTRAAMRPWVIRRLWPAMFRNVGGMLGKQASGFQRRVLSAAMDEGSRGGIAPVIHELALFYRNGWGIDWSALRAPVHLFHGVRDANVGFARALAASSATITFHLLDGGHMEAGADVVWQEILRTLRSALSATSV